MCQTVHRCCPFPFQAKSVYWLPNVIFSIIVMIAGLLILLLPETGDRPLPNTLHDIHQLYKPTEKPQHETKQDQHETKQDSVSAERAENDTETSTALLGNSDTHS